MLEPKPRHKFSITQSCRHISMGNIGPIGTMGAKDAMRTLGIKIELGLENFIIELVDRIDALFEFRGDSLTPNRVRNVKKCSEYLAFIY